MHLAGQLVRTLALVSGTTAAVTVAGVEGQCSIITFQLGVRMKILQYFDGCKMKKQVKIMKSMLLKMLLLIHQVTFITEIRQECQKQSRQQDITA